MQTTSTRQKIRQTIRQRRRSLTAIEQQNAEHALLARFCAHPAIMAANTLALYLSVDGEISTRALIEHCWQSGKRVCLPVVHPFSAGNLLFLQYQPDSEMVSNQYQIPEPRLDVTQVVPIEHLEVICTPLVAFDSTGQRLGMGGGYYDRTLAHWHKTKQGALPVGFAHDCQQVEHLDHEAWDVPLPHILTPSRSWHWPEQ